LNIRNPKPAKTTAEQSLVQVKEEDRLTTSPIYSRVLSVTQTNNCSVTSSRGL